jgi:4-hydroxybenzoate polyprenyltransferase
VLAVSALTSLLALVAGRGWGTLWVLGAVLTGQLFVGWSNDLIDADLDRRQGRSDKPLAARRIVPGVVMVAAVVALALCVPLSLASGLAAGVVHLAAVASATAYNLGLKTTAASALPYAVSFGLLPSFVSLGLPTHHLAPSWVMAAGALLGVGGHFTQSLPDIARDRAQGLHGLPQRLGPRASSLLAASRLPAASGLVAVGPARPSALSLGGFIACALATAGVVLAALSGRPLAAFRLTLLSAGVVVSAFVAGGGSAPLGGN